jgi:intracellular septation protein
MLEILSAIVFIVAYKMGDIYSATVALLITQSIIVFYKKFYKNNLKKGDIITTAILFGFGGLTLFFRNPNFIIMKPTVLFGLLGMAIIISEMIDKSLFKMFINATINNPKNNDKESPEIIPERISKSSYLVGGLLLFMAVANYYVATNYTEEQWVYYKLYSGIPFAIGIMSIMLYMTNIIFPNKKTKKEI